MNVPRRVAAIEVIDITGDEEQEVGVYSEQLHPERRGEFATPLTSFDLSAVWARDCARNGNCTFARIFGNQFEDQPQLPKAESKLNQDSSGVCERLFGPEQDLLLQEWRLRRIGATNDAGCKDGSGGCDSCDTVWCQCDDSVERVSDDDDQKLSGYFGSMEELEPSTSLPSSPLVLKRF